MTHSALATATLAAAIAIPNATFGDPPFFRGLGQLPGQNYSAATAISSDGQIVVAAGFGLYGAYRWTPSGGVLALPGRFLPSDVSNAGTIAGTYINVAPDLDGEAARWTEASGLALLGELPGDSWSMARAVSDNGDTLVGTSGELWDPWLGPVDGNAFRAGSDGNLHALHRLSGYSYTRAVDISGDGSTIVGIAWSGPEPQAVRWVQPGGIESLGLPPEASLSMAVAISQNSDVVLGSASPGGWFRWTQATDWESIEPSASVAFQSLSGDGSVVVGGRNIAPPDGYESEAVMWNTSVGTQRLADVLTSCLGLDLSGWMLSYASDISSDGLTIVGAGVNPSGQTEAWIAHLGHNQCPPGCLGDLDGNSVVDLSDLATLLTYFGDTSGATYADGDLDNDSDVDLSDLAALLAAFGTTCP